MVPALISGPEDWRRRALVMLPAGLLAACLGVGKIVRDCSLTCNVGFRQAPLALLAIAILTLPLAAGAVRGERRWGYARWHAGSLLAGASSLLAFRLVTLGLQLGLQRALATGGPASPWSAGLRWTYLAFYVWVGALAVLLGANVLAHFFRVFGPDEREHAIGILPIAIAAGGLAGSLFSGWSARLLMGVVDWPYETVRDNLMLAMAGLLFLQRPLVRAIAARNPLGSMTGRGTRRPQGAGLTRPGRGLVVALLIVTLFGGVADSILKYVFYWLVSLQTGDGDGRTLYFAAFYSWMNGVNLLFLALGTGRLIQRAGLVPSLASLPFATGAGTAALVVSPAVGLLYALRVVENSLRSVLYEPALDRVFLRLPGDLAWRLQPLLKGVGPRTGEGLGAVLLLGLGARAAFGPGHAAILLFGVLLAWLVAVLALRGRLAPSGAGRPTTEHPLAGE